MAGSGYFLTFSTSGYACPIFSRGEDTFPEEEFHPRGKRACCINPRMEERLIPRALPGAGGEEETLTHTPHHPAKIRPKLLAPVSNDRRKSL